MGIGLVSILNPTWLSLFEHMARTLTLLSLLWIQESSAAAQFKQVRVFVIPTDQSSVQTLRTTLNGSWNSQKKDKTQAKHVRVSLMEFPDWLYEQHGTYLESL